MPQATKIPTTVKSAVKMGTKKVKKSTDDIMKSAKKWAENTISSKKNAKSGSNVVDTGKSTTKKASPKGKNDVKMDSSQKVKDKNTNKITITLGNKIDITPSLNHSSVSKSVRK